MTKKKQQFSQEECLASLGHLQVNERGRQITETSGRKLLNSLDRFARIMPFSKMFLGYLVGTKDFFSSIYVLNWKLKATKYCRLYYHLQASERGTKGTGSGSLPTMDCSDRRSMKSKQWGVSNVIRSLPTLRSQESGNYQYSNGDKTRPKTLTLTGKLRSIPTLTNSTATMQDLIQAQFHSSKRPEYKSITTLSARDYKDTPGMTYQAGKRNRRDRPGRQIGYETGLKLHPNFAEVMQGFPIGWTELKD